MSVWKIAAGVFLGNLLFGLLAWMVVSTVTQARQASDDRQAAETQLHQLQQQYSDNKAAPAP